MIETKKEAGARWKREGRDKEVSAFRNKAEADLRVAGLSLGKAKDAAFNMAVGMFPPLAQPHGADPAVGDTAEPWGDWEDAIAQAGLPEAWGTLAESAPLDAEVEWVHQNRVLVVEDRPGKRPLFHWERARTPAPSYGAVNLMEFAATNRKGFMDILQRVKPGMGGDDDEVRREKVKVEEIRRVLEELRELEGAKEVGNGR